MLCCFQSWHLQTSADCLSLPPYLVPPPGAVEPRAANLHPTIVSGCRALLRLVEQKSELEKGLWVLRPQRPSSDERERPAATHSSPLPLVEDDHFLCLLRSPAAETLHSPTEKKEQKHPKRPTGCRRVSPLLAQVPEQPVHLSASLEQPYQRQNFLEVPQPAALLHMRHKDYRRLSTFSVLVDQETRAAESKPLADLDSECYPEHPRSRLSKPAASKFREAGKKDWILRPPKWRRSPRTEWSVRAS